MSDLAKSVHIGRYFVQNLNFEISDDHKIKNK